MIIHANKVVLYEQVKPAYIEVIDGVITKIIDGRFDIPCDIDYGDNMIIPGIIDTHNHGGAGYRFDTTNKEETLKLLKAESFYGVTGIFATTFTTSQFPLLAQLAQQDVEGTQILGINSEGPWGARVGEKGVNNGYPAVDLDLAQKMLDAAQGYLKVMDIAPEIEHGLDAIDFFVKNGITVSQYHTNATYQQAMDGIEHGTSVCTHLFNVMTGLHHRDVGVAGASILSNKVDCELICDGNHVLLEMIELAMRMKAHDRIMLISDNTAYLGAPQGYYRGAKKDANNDRAIIHVNEQGFVLSQSGRLSGSSKPVIYGMKNLVQKLGMDIVDVCHMASFNPARKYGLIHKGEININKDGDFVVIDKDFNVLNTYVKGKLVYDSKVDKLPFNQKFLDDNYIGETL